MEGSVAKPPPNRVDDVSADLEFQRQVEAYTDERKMLIDRCHEAHRDLDKWTLTLSSGALGISITALGAISGMGWQSSQLCVGFAWTCFSLSIIAVIVSIWCSAKCYEAFRVKIDEAIQSHFDTWQDEARKQQQGVFYSSLIDYMNFAGLGFFVLGMIFLICFSLSIAPQNPEVDNGREEQRVQGIETTEPRP